MTFYFYVWLYPPRFLELYLLKEAKKEVKSLSITHKKKASMEIGIQYTSIEKTTLSLWMLIGG